MIVFEKVELLRFATLMKALYQVPCYGMASDNVRVRMCRFCSDLVLDEVAKFAILHLREDGATESPPHEDPLKVELEYLPY